MADNAKESLNDVKLTVYSAEWCPDCRRFKSWLDSEGVAYDYVGIDQDEKAASYLESQTGKRAIPYVQVNEGPWVRGYHKESSKGFDPELFLSEVSEAASS